MSSPYVHVNIDRKYLRYSFCVCVASATCSTRQAVNVNGPWHGWPAFPPQFGRCPQDSSMLPDMSISPSVPSREAGASRDFALLFPSAPSGGAGASRPSADFRASQVSEAGDASDEIPAGVCRWGQLDHAMLGQQSWPNRANQVDRTKPAGLSGWGLARLAW